MHISLLGALLLTLAACQSTGSHGLGTAIDRAQKVADRESGDSTEATVRIENQSFERLTVYAVGDIGVQTRIGMASGGQTTFITVPHYMVNSGAVLRFVLQTIDGRVQQQSESVYMAPGDEVTLTIPSS